MKSNHIWVVVLTFIFISSVAYSFTTVDAPNDYHHMFIITEHHDNDKVAISIDGKEYQQMNLKSRSEGAWDQNAVIQLIDQYEIEGWELQSVNQTGYNSRYWLRKK